MNRPDNRKPTWSDVKRQLADLDRRSLIKLIQDLYATRKENRGFLHAQFSLGNDVLKPYTTVIDRWACPDVVRNQDISFAKAKRAFSDYRKAVAIPASTSPARP